MTWFSANDMPKCSAEGCNESADPRWWMHGPDGKALPSCDGHGCLAKSEDECRCRAKQGAAGDFNA